MTVAKQIAVLIADESTLLCDALAAMLEGRGPYRVVGQCRDGLTAVKLIASLEPDAALVDLDLPELHGAAVIQRVRRSGATARLLVMAARGDRRTVSEVLRTGASGFLLKTDRAEHLFAALTAITSGSIYISPQVRLTELFTPRRSAPPATAFEGLSPREHQVFSLLIRGLRGKEIAARLDLSPKTVNAYRTNLMRKLEIHDLAGLVRFAIEENLA